MTDRGAAAPWPLGEPAEAAYAAAHRRLWGAFDDHRADCAWVEAPFGRVFLARTRKGLVRVSFRRSEDDFLAGLEERQVLPRMAPERLDTERRQLERYFAGRLDRFELPVDLRGLTVFQRQVLDGASRIPFGRVLTYAELARRIDRPGAQRAVGNALGRNPVAIVIPCHRVIASGGSLGGYTGGLDIKRVLMDIEGIHLTEESS